MHFTRFEINPARRAARSLVASPQKLHAAFPPTAQAEREGRVMWRVDQYVRQTVLYLASPGKPDLTHLVEQVGWPSSHGWDTRDYTTLLDRLATGGEWRFRLKVNPVSSRRKTAAAERSQRFGHVTVAQQTSWLLDRAERNGFTVPQGEHGEPDVAVRGRETLTFPRSTRAANPV
jgi:CRISPR system Cascade subunit CasE